MANSGIYTTALMDHNAHPDYKYEMDGATHTHEGINPSCGDELTLSLRVERHVENALKVVDFLKNHPQVERVNHPSLSTGRAKELYDEYYPNGAASIFTFEIKGTAETACKFTENLKLFSLLANVADVKSLVIHPASTTHSQLTNKELEAAGISPTTIRLSIGTENIKDILADLEQGFDAVK